MQNFACSNDDALNSVYCRLSCTVIIIYLLHQKVANANIKHAEYKTTTAQTIKQDKRVLDMNCLCKRMRGSHLRSILINNVNVICLILSVCLSVFLPSGE